MGSKFELIKTTDGKFLFNLRSASGQVVFVSEPYENKSEALEVIETTRSNSLRVGAFVAKANAKGQPYFLLKGTDGREIGRSDFFSSKSAMEDIVESVKRSAPEATLNDLTE